MPICLHGYYATGTVKWLRYEGWGGLGHCVVAYRKRPAYKEHGLGQGDVGADGDGSDKKWPGVELTVQWGWTEPSEDVVECSGAAESKAEDMELQGSNLDEGGIAQLSERHTETDSGRENQNENKSCTGVYGGRVSAVAS